MQLKKREQRRLLAGHPWAFSNEIDTAVTPLKGLAPGAAVELYAADGKWIGHGLANPSSLIAVRLFSRQRHQAPDEAHFRNRIEAAWQLRRLRYPEPYYRLIYSEADGLPGLVVDRYGPHLVMQLSTAAMDVRCELLVALLCEVLRDDPQPVASIELQNDLPVRELEGLDRYRRYVFGTAPDELVVIENGLRFVLPAGEGQKTGWFYDHRENRRALRNWVAGKRVLDLYTYCGGFAFNAIEGGAREVIAVDGSAPALAVLDAQRAAAGVDPARLQTRCMDVVTLMRELRDAGERFDVIVIDPPAFIKRRKDQEAGLRHYGLNNRLAMQLLAPGGVLFSASCSQALDQAAHLDVLKRNMPGHATRLQVLGELGQGPDHPVLAAMPESRYLSGAIVRPSAD